MGLLGGLVTFAVDGKVAEDRINPCSFNFFPSRI